MCGLDRQGKDPRLSGTLGPCVGTHPPRRRVQPIFQARTGVAARRSANPASAKPWGPVHAMGSRHRTTSVIWRELSVSVSTASTEAIFSRVNLVSSYACVGWEVSRSRLSENKDFPCPTFRSASTISEARRNVLCCKHTRADREWGLARTWNVETPEMKRASGSIGEAPLQKASPIPMPNV
jgi:hypothetical protein